MSTAQIALDAAIQVAEEITSKIPPRPTVMSRWVKDFDHEKGARETAANDAYQAAAAGAWRVACIMALRIEQERDSEDVKIDWASSIRSIEAEPSHVHLRSMATGLVSNWASYDISDQVRDHMA